MWAAFEGRLFFVPRLGSTGGFLYLSLWRLGSGDYFSPLHTIFAVPGE